MTVNELTDQLLVIKAAQAYLGAMEKTVRDQLTEQMDPGDRKVGHAGDVKIGTVTLTAPKGAWRVRDGHAWRGWVREHAPDEIVIFESVNSAYESAMLARGCDLNGEPLPGVEFVTPDPVVQARPAPDALAAIVTAYGSLGSRLAAIEAAQ